MRAAVLACTILALAAGCERTTNLVNASSDAGDLVDARAFADADPSAPDAGPSAGCLPGGLACNNCVDDDGDGDIDGADAECTGATDDDESRFGGGGGGPKAHKQDCLWDGDARNNNDGCDLHICCVIDGDCPSGLKPQQYDPGQCTPTSTCVDNCVPLTPPGCDCFGCCRLCNDEGCFDVMVWTEGYDDCTAEVADDDERCLPCTQSPTCQTPLRPDDRTPCQAQTDCTSGQYCSRGYCIMAFE